MKDYFDLPYSFTKVEYPNSDIILSDNDIVDIFLNSTIKDLIKNKCLVVVNDHHRATPTARILNLIYKLENNIDHIIIASGTHNPPKDNMIKKILGEVPSGIKISKHSIDNTSWSEFGTTQRGTRIIVNSIIDGYEHILLINSVEPHYFAGYTGGVKSIIPGLASKITVEKNHSWAMHENCYPGNIDTNPLQNDLREGFNLINVNKIINAIQIVGSDKIHGITTGNVIEAQNEAIQIAEKIYVTIVPEKVDLIIAIINSPLNMSLYQAQKGIENTRIALKKGGKFILIAQCTDGIGNNAFYETLSRFNEPKEVMDTLNMKNYKFGDHKAYKFASIAKDYELFIHSSITLSAIRQLFAKSISSDGINDIINDVLFHDQKAIVVLDAGMSVLKLQSSFIHKN